LDEIFSAARKQRGVEASVIILKHGDGRRAISGKLLHTAGAGSRKKCNISRN